MKTLKFDNLTLYCSFCKKDVEGKPGPSQNPTTPHTGYFCPFCGSQILG